ncbi:SAM-dependent methyltransferase [Effusibacillus lacus]|uniref:SAM-dependent methyltransferase n=1 Tax=Effusibacillus lacus TaxID=1348429 RepID=A0A292YTM4_9BACL|nr:SAM-dependent methyltransferase [Effusibacillus lacus]
MAVTTVPNPSADEIRLAQELAAELQVQYVPRSATVSKMQKQMGVLQMLVAGKRLTLHAHGREIFFHPSMAVVRVKRMLLGDTDLMVEKSGLQSGDVVLDCTLGMGSDAIVFAHAVGTRGKVIGLEQNPVLAALVRIGMRNWPSDVLEVAEAMRRVEVVAAHHLDFMRTMPDQSVDIVYFDPMFRSTVKESVNFDPIRELSITDAISPNSVEEAKRIARKSIVLKERAASGEFERLGFPPPLRRSSSFTYSVIFRRGEESF